MSLLLLVLFGGFQLLRHAEKLPAVFQPRMVQLVHYDLVHTPVRVSGCDSQMVPQAQGLMLQLATVLELRTPCTA